MDITKPADANCPICREKPAEFKLASEPFTRWRCHACGAEGRIEAAAIAPQPPKAKPHWSNKFPAPFHSPGAVPGTPA